MKLKMWEKIESLYDQAIELASEDRLSFIKRQSGGDKEILAQVQKMIESYADEFMEELPGLAPDLETMKQTNPKIIGHFKIIEKVATGGMGRVYKAQSLNSDVAIQVALKTIRIELSNPELETKFHNEKQILSKLKHKNIASLIDAGVSKNNIPYIATEWVEGKTIGVYCHDLKLSIVQRLVLFKQICSAVSFAHTKLIIHRDLKPENIMVDANNQIKLLDFGIAKIIDESQNLKTQTQIFTPDYAAPEQINGQMCTTVTDVYSLGVLLFEMLTNRRRFNLSTLSITDKIQAICHPKTFNISQVKADLPYSVSKLGGALNTIINKAMHVDPNRRYESVSELSKDLDNYLNKRTVSAMKDSPWYQTKMLIIRNKLASSLSAMVFVTIIFAVYLNNHQIQLKLKEAQKSEIMLAYFQGILEAASPAYGGSFNMTVKEMFESGIADFDLDKIEDSSIKAEIAAHLSLTYSQLSNPEKFMYYNQITTDYYAQHFDSKNNVSAFLNYSLREVNQHLIDKKFKNALATLTDLEMKIEGFEIDDKPLSVFNLYFALSYGGLGEHRNVSQARVYFDKAEKLAKKSSAYKELGEINFYKYQLFEDTNTEQQSFDYLEEAEKYFNKDEIITGQYNPNLAIIQSSKADLLNIKGELLLAQKSYALSNTMHRQIFGVENYATLINHSSNSMQLGEVQKALANLTKAEGIFNSEKRNKNINYYALQLYKANALTEIGQYQVAGDLYQQILIFMRELLPEGHRIISLVENAQSVLFLRTEQVQNIKASQIKIEKILQGSQIEEPKYQSLKLKCYFNLANIHVYKNEYDKAEILYKKARDMLKTQPKKYNQGWLKSAIETGYYLSKINQGDRVLKEQFIKSKVNLLNKFQESEWYAGFYSMIPKPQYRFHDEVSNQE